MTHGYFHTCQTTYPDGRCHCFDSMSWKVKAVEPDDITTITDPAALPDDVPDGDIGASEPDEPAAQEEQE